MSEVPLQMFRAAPPNKNEGNVLEHIFLNPQPSPLTPHPSTLNPQAADVSTIVDYRMLAGREGGHLRPGGPPRGEQCS